MQAGMRETGQQAWLRRGSANRAAQHQHQHRLEKPCNGLRRPAPRGLSLGGQHVGQRAETGAAITRDLQPIGSAVKHLCQRKGAVEAGGKQSVGLRCRPGVEDEEPVQPASLLVLPADSSTAHVAATGLSAAINADSLFTPQNGTLGH